MNNREWASWLQSAVQRGVTEEALSLVNKFREHAESEYQADLKEFTKSAMEGLLAGSDPNGTINEEAFGRYSVKIAKATLAALEAE